FPFPDRSDEKVWPEFRKELKFYQCHVPIQFLPFADNVFHPSPFLCQWHWQSSLHGVHVPRYKDCVIPPVWTQLVRCHTWLLPTAQAVGQSGPVPAFAR